MFSVIGKLRIKNIITVSSGNVRKIKKFFTFLNDAEDLQKRGIKKRDTIAQGQLYIYTEMLKSV